MTPRAVFFCQEKTTTEDNKYTDCVQGSWWITNSNNAQFLGEIPPKLSHKHVSIKFDTSKMGPMSHLMTPKRCISLVKFKNKNQLPSLKLTFSHLKMDGWNTTLLLGVCPFSGAFAVSFRECSGWPKWLAKIWELTSKLRRWRSHKIRAHGPISESIGIQGGTS